MDSRQAQKKAEGKAQALVNQNKRLSKKNSRLIDERRGLQHVLVRVHCLSNVELGGVGVGQLPEVMTLSDLVGIV